MATRNTFVVPKLSDFGAWAARIRRAVAAAESKEAKHETLRPEESSYGVLRIECYRYLRKLKRNDLTEQLRAYVEIRDPGRWHRHPGVDADWVLRLLERSRKQWLTPPRRARIVLELTFADRCGITSRWLLPFLYECGNQQIIKSAMNAAELPAWLTKYKRVSRARAAKMKPVRKSDS